MRKLYITLALIISSFFLFSSNTYAVTFNYSINESDFSYINSDFITVRNYAINYATENNCYYIIYYSDSLYKILFHKDFAIISNSISGGSYIRFTWHNSSTKPAIIMKYYNGNFDIESTDTGYNYKYTILLNGSRINYYSFLDTNFTKFYTDSTVILNYNDYSYTFDSSNGLFGLYDIYVDIFGEFEEPDIHLEEKTILSNFYTLIVDKINILSTAILSNYIYLSVIGIFIFIFLIELIFRRLL